MDAASLLDSTAPSLAMLGRGESVGVAAGIVVVAVVAWHRWRTQRTYALQLAEQAEQITAEQEKTRHARQQNEVLDRENRAKSEMIATLSREIRGHLSGILGSADLLLDNTLKSRERAQLATLRASAHSLHQSLNDVLDYSSIETGKIQIAHDPFDLRSPLIEVVETLTPLALMKQVEVVFIFAPDVPAQVVGDAARLRQVILNLVSNAVKFTTQGRVVLCVTISPERGSDAKEGTIPLHFSVSDTGARIPEEMHATIFDQASPSSSPSARSFGSSGLELAISKRLVELMGGKIGARSLPEGGSELWADLALPANKEPSPVNTLSSGGLHVVVLDELAAPRVALSAMLTRLGIDHDATETVAQACEVLHDAQEAEAHELVLILDDSVAREHGAKLAAMVAQDAALQKTRLVLMSSDPDVESSSGLDLPIAAFVRKPVVRAEALWEALRGPTVPAPRSAGSRAPFEVAPESKPTARRMPHVLVVDDDEISRSVSFQLLEILGCTVELAVNGPQAVERAQGTQFDLILMDCQMPEMNGFDATRLILERARGKAPPIVALTANTSEPDRNKCFAAGMSDFVAKPVRKMELSRVLKRWIPMGARAG